MKNLRILEANELGHGILIEMDAGFVSPKDEKNIKVLQEAANLDYRNMIPLTETEDSTLKEF